MRLALLALIAPLCLDTFAVSAALAAGGLARRRHLSTALLFAGGEAAMPLIGLGLGRPLGDTIGAGADYVAVALLLALGLYMLLAGDDEARLPHLAERSGAAGIALGLSVSLDELAIGFALGLARAPVVAVVVLIGVQAFAASLLGLRLGERLGARLRERAERLAGLTLLTLAVALFAVRLGEA